MKQQEQIMVDWTELQRLHQEGTVESWRTLGGLLVEAFPEIIELHRSALQLHKYLIETDDEGLIQHASQMRELGAALAAFDKETE